MHLRKGRAPRNTLTKKATEEIAAKITEAGAKISAIWHLSGAEREELYREVAQEIALRVLRKPQDPIRDLGGYVYRSLGNALIRRSVRISTFTPTEDDELQRRLDAQQSGADAERITERLWVREAVRQLPPESREVISLMYFADLATCDISKILNISESAVHKRKKKACELLRLILETSESGETS